MYINLSGISCSAIYKLHNSKTLPNRFTPLRQLALNFIFVPCSKPLISLHIVKTVILVNIRDF